MADLKKSWENIFEGLNNTADEAITILINLVIFHCFSWSGTLTKYNTGSMNVMHLSD